MPLPPQLVERAVRWADSLGFTQSCRHEVGVLLYILAGIIPSGRIADIGTGCGVSTAWITSATGLDIFMIDNDLSRAQGIRELFACDDARRNSVLRASPSLGEK